MLDCGMHMGFNDDVSFTFFSNSNLKFNLIFNFKRRFPDFSYISKEGPVTDYLDCVIIRYIYF